MIFALSSLYMGVIEIYLLSVPLPNYLETKESLAGLPIHKHHYRALYCNEHKAEIATALCMDSGGENTTFGCGSVMTYDIRTDKKKVPWVISSECGIFWYFAIFPDVLFWSIDKSSGVRLLFAISWENSETKNNI